MKPMSWRAHGLQKEGDGTPVFSLPPIGALQTLDTHLGSEAHSQTPNVHSIWKWTPNRSKTELPSPPL